MYMYDNAKSLSSHEQRLITYICAACRRMWGVNAAATSILVNRHEYKTGAWAPVEFQYHKIAVSDILLSQRAVNEF